MALAATTVWEIETGGSATVNGGAFDPGQTAGMLTDGAATSATGTAPVFTSASYNFAAGDVGAWVYISSGTNWTPGWYKIASVAANAATLNAATGQAVLAPGTPTVVDGCATTASPTSATWSIDYSQQSAAQFAYTDLASAGAGSAVSSVAFPFGKQQVGNAIRVTGGTNFTVGVYVITSVSVGLVATVVGAAALTTGAGVSGTGGLGGAMSTFAAVVSFLVAGNIAYVKSGTYTLTVTVTLSLVNNAGMQEFRGFGSVRGDNGARPLVTSATNSINLFTMASGPAGYRFFHLKFTSTAGTRGYGFTTTNTAIAYDFTWEDCIFDGLSRAIYGDVAVTFGIGLGIVANCEILNCVNEGIKISGTLFIDSCYIHNNGIDGIRDIGGGNVPGSWVVVNSVFYSNAGRGIYSTNSGTGPANRTQWLIKNCAFVSNTNSGVDLAPSGSPGNIVLDLDSNIFDSNGAFGVTLGATPSALFNRNNAYRSNTSGNRNNIPVGQADVALTGSPFTNAAGGDFSLNNTAGAGAACRAVGFPGVMGAGSGGTGYLDIGALQHQDSGGSSVFAVQVQNTVILNRFGVAGY